MSNKSMEMFKFLKLTNMQKWKRVSLAAVVTFLLLYVCSFYNISKSKSLLLSYVLVKDTLPLADGTNFTPPYKSIYFLETSCRLTLTSRELCAIESAARAHPHYQINVLVTAPIPKENLDRTNFKKELKNVRFAIIHIEKYTKNSPAEALVRTGLLNKSKWPIEHTSDMLRYLTLYKWGGIYLDTDVVVAKRLDMLASNWAARGDDTEVSAGAFAFSMDRLGRRMAKNAMREIRSNFRIDLWSHNGPGVLTRILQRKCKTNNVTRMSPKICGGFQVYGPEKFYPITWKNNHKYFEAGILETKDAYIYHVWNYLTKGRAPHKNSPYVQLARMYCPLTYSLYGDRFGL